MLRKIGILSWHAADEAGLGDDHVAPSTRHGRPLLAQNAP